MLTKLSALGMDTLLGLLFLSFASSCATVAPQRLTEPAIITASEKGDLQRVTKELATGANVDARDEFGNTPLMVAAQRGHLDIVRFLVERGADINARNNANLNALAFLALYQQYGSALTTGGERFTGFGVTLPGHLAAAEYLIDKGLDVNASVGKTGSSTVLLQAIALDKEELVQLLLRKGADPDMPNDKGATPLMVAAYRGNKRIVQLLFHEGVAIDATDAHGRTAVDLATDEEVNHFLRTRCPFGYYRRIGVSAESVSGLTDRKDEIVK